MSFQTEQQTGSESSSAVLKTIILTLFAIVTAVVSVSFAANHMRIGFEKEYNIQIVTKTQQLAAASSLLISGDEIAADPVTAQTKYVSVLPALLIDSKEKNQSRKIYGLYSYTNGELTTLLQSSSEGLRAAQIHVSDWLTTEAQPYYIQSNNQYTVLTPIKDSQGKVVGLFELSSTYTFLDEYGNAVEKRVLMSVMVAVAAGIALFSLQYIIPQIVRISRHKGEKY